MICMIVIMMFLGWWATGLAYERFRNRRDRKRFHRTLESDETIGQLIEMWKQND